MTDYLRCPYCGQPVWSTDEGARCTDRDYATGFSTEDRSCGATWDSVGAIETAPRGEFLPSGMPVDTALTVAANVKAGAPYGPAPVRRALVRLAAAVAEQRRTILALLLLAQQQPRATTHELRARACPGCGHSWYRHETIGRCVQPVEVNHVNGRATGFEQCGCRETRT